MLFVVFSVGDERFVIETSHIVEVLPLVNWKRVSGGADGVAGVMNFHHTAVPVVDMSMLLTGMPVPARMSGRILMTMVAKNSTETTSRSDDSTTMLALLVDRVLGTTRYDVADFVRPPAVVDTTPYLGAVLMDERGIIQHIEIDHILSPRARARVVASADRT